MEGILELVNELSSLPNLAVAVPCGNEALWALTQERGITKWRGSVMESTLINGLKVIPVMHPAWYFHTQQWHQLIIGEWDWQRIKRESAFKGVVRPRSDFTINPTPEEMLDAVERYTNAEYITVDTEWYSPDKMAYVGFADNEHEALTIP